VCVVLPLCPLSCRDLLFLQRLLAGGAYLEDVWPESGETPLLMAINYRDVEVKGWVEGLNEPGTWHSAHCLQEAEAGRRTNDPTLHTYQHSYSVSVAAGA
jgi:hypothetical protein